MVCEEIKMNLYVGSRIGTFKHVFYDENPKKKRKDTSKHLQDIKSLQKGDGITCMVFKDQAQTEIMIARENRTVQTYNLLTCELKESTEIDFGKGRIQRLATCGESVVAAVESGIVKVWKSKMDDGFELNVGCNIEEMRSCQFDGNLIATGGKENDLKLWNLERKQCVFEAKNVPHDWLQLRVPIWVSGACFLPEDGKQIAICSRYGVVRLYDTRAQRRPVCSVEFPGQANTCIALGCQDRQVVIGTGRGVVQMVDLRGKGRPDRGFKGPAGSVTGLLCARGRLVSVSLDRHLRIHDATTKDLLHKQYMTSKLTCFLLRSSTTPLPGDEALETELKAEAKEEDLEEEQDLAESDPEYDQMFQEMEVIRDGVSEKRKKSRNKAEKIIIEDDLETEPKSLKKKRGKAKEQEVQIEAETPKKKKKSKEMEVTTEKIDEDELPGQMDQSQLNESIKKLLRSTEKAKRKIEKQKKEKKKKSLF